MRAVYYQFGPEKHLTNQRVISLKVSQGLVNGASWGRTFKHCGFAWSMGRWFYWVNAIDTLKENEKTFLGAASWVPPLAPVGGWKAGPGKVVFSQAGRISGK